jgi:glyoxylase-like metal-dependent hydrolase (beta-lactamase superfamily II)
MHRSIKIHWACLGLLLLLHAYAASAFGQEIKLQPVKVAPSVYYFMGESGMASAANKGFMSNAGFIVTSDGVVVFDALATPALGEAMLNAIREITAKPVKHVFISHYHADHFYGLQPFKAQGAKIWAHESERTTLNSEFTLERLKQRRTDLYPWVNDDTRLIPADQWLRFKEKRSISFKLGTTNFRVIDASGAHSPGDIMLYVEEQRVLFSGDLFFTGRIPFVGDANSKSWLETLGHMLETNPQIVVPGHGKMSANPGQDMTLTRDYLLFLREHMGKAVDEMVPFDEAYRNVDWSRFAQYPAFEQANRINAYGTYLLMEKESLGKS